MKAAGQKLITPLPVYPASAVPLLPSTFCLLPSAFSARRRGFTLLEVALAIAILCIVSVTLYQFVDTTMRAATYSEKSGREDAALSGLRRLVATQLAALPANQGGSLIGLNVKGRNGRHDALQLVCPAGNALLTPDARGFYQITLDLRERPRGSGHYALGMERQPWTDDNDDSDDEDKPGSVQAQLPADWVELMDGVRALEIAYFDARLNGWVDKWTDQNALPNLVRVRLATADRPEPYEIVTRVPGGGLTRVIPTTAEGNAANLLSSGALTRVAPTAAVNGTVSRPVPAASSSNVGNTVLPNGFVVPTPPPVSAMYPGTRNPR